MGTAKALRVWDAAQLLAADIIDAVNRFEKKDPAGIGRQLARAAASVSANIAEGAGRGAAKEQLQFYRIARGSLEETRNHLGMAWKAGLLTKTQYLVLSNRAVVVGRMLASLIARLEAR